MEMFFLENGVTYMIYLGHSAFTRGYNILRGLELPNNILIRTLIFKMSNEVIFLILLNRKL